MSGPLLSFTIRFIPEPLLINSTTTRYCASRHDMMAVAEREKGVGTLETPHALDALEARTT